VSAFLGLLVRCKAGDIDQSGGPRGKLGFVTAGGLIAELCFISNHANPGQLESNMHRVASALAEVLT